MKIIEKEKFKEVFAKTVFLNTIAVIAGMILSYILIDIVYPYNFVIIFVITAISGAYLVVGTLSIEEISGNKENNKNLTLKEVLNVQKEKNCINMCLGKIILNFGYGITLLYAMLAIESGYTSRQIVELGFITFISMAICASVAGKLNMTHKQNMIAGHLLVAISVFSLFLTSNFYVAVVLIGLSNGIVNIGYYGFQNSLGEKRRHIYMSTQTTINITTGMGVFVAAKLIDNYSVNVAIIYSIVAVIISIGFVLRLKVPEEKLEILLEN